MKVGHPECQPEITDAMVKAGAQALANDVWHPPQPLMSLALYEQDKFKRQARIVLEAAYAMPLENR